jgi:hypothetical protein
MSARQRRELLERLNTLDAGPTEDDRRAEREARIRQEVQTATFTALALEIVAAAAVPNGPAVAPAAANALAFAA